MAKLIMISLLVATVAIPLACARHRNPHRGLKRALLGLLLFNAAYIALLVYVYVPLAWPAIAASVLP